MDNSINAPIKVGKVAPDMKEEYKSVCDTCGRKTWYDKEQQCYCEYTAKITCKACGHSKDKYPPSMVRCKGTLRLIDNSQLDSRFDRAYQNNYRVEVTWKKGFEDYSGYGSRTNGRKTRFKIGKSIGWKPIYLQIYSRRSTGGQSILSSAVETITIL